MDKERRQKLREGTLALSDYMTFQTDGDMAVSLTRNADIAGKVVLSVHASSECSEPSSLMSANPGISKSFSLTTDDAQELSRFLQMAGISQDTQSKAMDFVTKSGSIPEPMVTAQPVDTDYVSIAVMEREGEGEEEEWVHARSRSPLYKANNGSDVKFKGQIVKKTAERWVKGKGGYNAKIKKTVDEEFKYEKGWSTRPTADGKHEVYHHEKGTVHPDRYNKQGDAQATADRLANDGLEEGKGKEGYQEWPGQKKKPFHNGPKDKDGKTETQKWAEKKQAEREAAKKADTNEGDKVDRMVGHIKEDNFMPTGMLDKVADEMIGNVPAEPVQKRGNIEAAVAEYHAQNAGTGEIDDQLLHGISDEYSVHPMILRAAIRDTDQSDLNEVSAETLASYKKKAGEDARNADKEGDFERGNKRFRGIVQATKKEFDKVEKVDESMYDKDSEEEAIEVFKRTGEWPNWFSGYARRMAEIRMERDKDKPEVVPVKVEEDVADLHLTPEEMEQARAFASGDSYDISEMLYDKLVGYYGTIPSEDPLEWIKDQLTHDLAVGEQEEYPLQPESPEFGGRTQNPGANTHMGDNPLEETWNLPDTEFYASSDGGIWNVIGKQTGKTYRSPRSKIEAESIARTMTTDAQKTNTPSGPRAMGQPSLEEDTDNDYGHHRGPRKVGQITGFDMKGRRDIQSPGANTKQSDNPMSASAVMETAASKMKKLMEAVNWSELPGS